MKRLSVQLSKRQAEQLLNQLSPRVKIHFVRRWQQETWEARFRQLVARVQQRARRNPHLTAQALREIEPARRAFYAGRRRH